MGYVSLNQYFASTGIRTWFTMDGWFKEHHLVHQQFHMDNPPGTSKSLVNGKVFHDPFGNQHVHVREAIKKFKDGTWEAKR